MSSDIKDIMNDIDETGKTFNVLNRINQNLIRLIHMDI